MDGRSFLPLLVNRHRHIKDTWPDTFLIESSGRRETPEQIARATLSKYPTLQYTNDTTVDIRKRENDTSVMVDIGSPEIDDQDDDGRFFGCQLNRIELNCFCFYQMVRCQLRTKD